MKLTKESELARCEAYHMDVVNCELCLDVGIVPEITYDSKINITKTIYHACSVCKNMNYGFMGLTNNK